MTVPLRPLVPRKHLTFNLASACSTHTWPSLPNTKSDVSLRSPAVFAGAPRERVFVALGAESPSHLEAPDEWAFLLSSLTSQCKES